MEYSLWGTNFSSECLNVPGNPFSALSNGCSWYTATNGSGYLYYGDNAYGGFGFDSGDEVSAVVDRTPSNSGSNGVVRFLRNRKALETKPLPIGFADDAVLVVSFGRKGGCAKIVSFE